MVIYLFFFIPLCAQTIRFVYFFVNFLYQIEKYFVNLHPQTESSVVGRRSCIYMIGVY